MRLQPPGLHCQRTDDQAELAVTAQGQCAENGGAGAETKLRKRQEEQHDLHRHQQDEDASDDQVRPSRQAGQADLQEKPDQQQVFERKQRVGQFSGARMAGHDDTQHQRAQIRLQPGHAEAAGPDTQRREQAEQHHQLAMAEPPQQCQQRHAQHQYEDQRNRPDFRQFAASKGQKHDGEQVLQHQNADSGAAVQRAVLAAVVQVLDREYGGGERQRKAQGQRTLPRHAAENTDANRTGCQRAAAEHRCGERRVAAGSRPDFDFQQPPRLQLQPDQEQQQRHAQIRDGVQRRTALQADSIGGKASDQKAHERRLPQLPRSEAEQKSQTDQKRVHRHSGLRRGRQCSRIRLAVPNPRSVAGGMERLGQRVRQVVGDPRRAATRRRRRLRRPASLEPATRRSARPTRRRCRRSPARAGRWC